VLEDGDRLPLRSPPPALGQDNARILGELGYSAAAIASLASQGIIRGTG